MEALKTGRVCVTGAGGFVASWLVKVLLCKGYSVHGTVRDPGSEKNAHLRKLEGARENLQLFKADLLDYNSLCRPITGCDIVFHVASPVPSSSVPDPVVELLEPAVDGTLNVLKASFEAKVRRVIFVSSAAAVAMNPTWPEDKIMDENCWSDEEYCRTTGNWYFLSKTSAEREALDYAEKNGLNVVSVCPPMILGPMLQPTMNSSISFLSMLLTGKKEKTENRVITIVDVRDVAEALLLVNKNVEASGRYICAAHAIRISDLVEKLRSLYPYHKNPPRYLDAGRDVNLSSEKLKRLGWKFRPLEETLIDTINCLDEAGFLKV